MENELLSDTPIARATDPESSHEAADEVTGDGTRASQQWVIFSLVTKNPGCTSDELASVCYLDRYQVARRLPELEDAGYIRRGALRMSGISGRKATTWWPGRKK